MSTNMHDCDAEDEGRVDSRNSLVYQQIFTHGLERLNAFVHRINKHIIFKIHTSNYNHNKNNKQTNITIGC